MLSGLIFALAVSQNPATLAGETYYLASELDELEHHFDPDHWVDGEPMRIDFDAPGKVSLSYAQEGDDCTFTATGTGKRTTYLLSLSCKAGSLARAHWTWVGPGRAKTSLLSNDATPELLKEVALRKTPVDIKALQAAFDGRYASAQLPKLVGTYQDGKGVTLTVASDGTATLAGTAIKLALKRCSAEPPLPATAPCLARLPPEGEPQVGSTVFFAVEQEGHVVLEEGRFGSDVAYFPFESVPHARKFARVEAAKP